jgi:hypothetical protein
MNAGKPVFAQLFEHIPLALSRIDPPLFVRTDPTRLLMIPGSHFPHSTVISFRSYPGCSLPGRFGHLRLTGFPPMRFVRLFLPHLLFVLSRPALLQP